VRLSPYFFIVSKRRFFAGLLISYLFGRLLLLAQIPNINAGPDGFAQIDFAQMYLDQINKQANKTAKQKAADQELIDSGALSAFDLEAPNKAIEQYNRASTLLKVQKSKEAIKYLQKAIEDYPKFVSAHVALGRAYVDVGEKEKAKNEFESATAVDPKYAMPLLDLGRLAMSSGDFQTAQSELEKAEKLRPNDPKILSTLAYAENGNHQYLETLATVQRMHGLAHKGMANAHYVAASAAQSLKDYAVVERELTIFLNEDPSSEYAPVARQNLAILARNKAILAANAAAKSQGTTLIASPAVAGIPNSEHLKAELNALGKESDCDECASDAESNAAMAGLGNPLAPSHSVSRTANGMWLIRASVDDVAVFFSASRHGRMVDDLKESEIQIRDDNKPPVRLLEFSPQAKLPLRLALLIDTSGSVHDRFSFEKNAAARFVEKVLNPKSDLAFVEGFSTEPNVTQDFTSDTTDLSTGIHKLSNGGGTALFDAVSIACGKLGAYPETEHVARVLVILSDGEDNSSHRSLRQTVDAAERAGVTVYAISTKEERSDKTDADRILEELAERTGGEAMFPGDVLTLGHSFDKLREVIRSRYFVAYKPADFRPDGSYRTITIVAKKDGKRLLVRARKGYHARAESNSSQ